MFRLPPSLPRDVPEGAALGGERVLLSDLQNAAESSRNAEQERQEGPERSPQTLCPEASREDAGTAARSRTTSGTVMAVMTYVALKFLAVCAKTRMKSNQMRRALK